MKRHRASPATNPSPQALGIIAAALISVSATAHAADGSLDYRFEVVDQPVAVSARSEFDVRLTNVTTGQQVDNATVTGSILNMSMPRHLIKGSSPDWMTYEMWGEVHFLGTPAPGLYRFLGDVSMPGVWKLRVSAKVPGEPEAINGSVRFKAGH